MSLARISTLVGQELRQSYRNFVFPTNYLFSPVMKLAEGTFAVVRDGWEMAVLAGVFVLSQGVLATVVRRMKRRALAW